MSMISPTNVVCPNCETRFETEAFDSVNADRRPDLRAQVLDDSLQSVACPNCETAFRVEPTLNYLDIGRGQWISTFEADRVGDWVASEREADETFAEAYGARAGEAAQEVGRELTPRVVFGWPAMREKLVIRELGLDDVTVELVKLAILRGVEDVPMEVGIDLRLYGATDEDLQFVRQDAGTGELVDTLLVPRPIYDDIGMDADWDELRTALGQGTFVDLQRLYLDGVAGEPAAAA